MSNGLQLLIFDWDGTLMDSEARILACMQAAAADLGLDIPSDAAVRDIIGLGLSEAVQRLFPAADPALVARLVSRYRHHYLYQDETPTPLFSGADTVLRELAGRGYLLAVATGKGRQGLERALQQAGLAKLFHATRCADEAFSKPHPEMLLQILDELGVAAERAVMIGDTDYDMQMAGNAGVKALAVGYGAHSRERLLAHGPAGLIADINELVDWLDCYY